MDNIVEYLIDRLDLCENYLRDLCVDKSEAFNRLVSTKREDLPTLINEPSPLGPWACERLKDPTEEEWDTPECWIEFLNDEEMSYDEYRGLGVNDGELQSIAGIFNEMGMEKEAQRALMCQYSCD